VTIVLGSLEKNGMLELRRGEIHITDRRRLEAGSCECYRMTQQEYDRLLPECNGHGRIGD